MKTNDFNNMEIEELSISDIKETNVGAPGFWAVVGAGIIVAAAVGDV